MKQKLLIPLLCLALILPVYQTAAQEEEAEHETAYEAPQAAAPAPAQTAPSEAAQTTAPEAAQAEETESSAQPTQEKKAAASPAKSSPAQPAQKKTTVSPVNSPIPGLQKGIDGIFNKIVYYLSKIANVFGKATGIRIGGTTITAIATFIIARLIQDKAPPWVKWLLYAGGGTMVAGSSANITQLLMEFLG